jgi:NADH:ubiquinone oxidoreductase subunit D
LVRERDEVVQPIIKTVRNRLKVNLWSRSPTTKGGAPSRESMKTNMEELIHHFKLFTA